MKKRFAALLVIFLLLLQIFRIYGFAGNSSEFSIINIAVRGDKNSVPITFVTQEPLISVEFSSPLKLDYSKSNGKPEFTITNDGNKKISTDNITIMINGNILTISIYENLEYDTEYTIHFPKGGPLVSLNGDQLITDYQVFFRTEMESLNAGRNNPIFSINNDTDRKISDLMTKKGWIKMECADLVWEGLHILLKAIGNLTEDEILSRVDNRIDYIFNMDSTDYASAHGGFYRRGSIGLEKGMFTVENVTHELLHSVSDYRGVNEIKGIPGGYFYPVGLTLYAINDNRTTGLREFKGMPYKTIGGRFNEGFTDFLSLKANGSDIYKSDGDAEAGIEFVTYPGGYYIEMGLCIPAIYALGEDKVEGMYLGNNEAYTTITNNFNIQYGEETWRYIAEEVDDLSIEYHKISLSSIDERLKIKERLISYIERLINICRIRYRQSLGNSTEISNFMRDFKNFKKFLPVIKNKTYAGLDSLEKEIQLLSSVLTAEPSIDLTGASTWATAEISEAARYGLVTDRVLGTYKANITREEFCELAVKLYEALSGSIAMPVSPNPFKDTSNPEILKANKLGIVFGINGAQDMFGPSLPITRQEISVMICRVLKAAFPDFVPDTEGTLIFPDEDMIADWALESMKHCNKNSIIFGMGGGRIDPRGYTSKEQGILIIKRSYVKFRI